MANVHPQCLQFLSRLFSTCPSGRVSAVDVLDIKRDLTFDPYSFLLDVSSLMLPSGCVPLKLALGMKCMAEYTVGIQEEIDMVRPVAGIT